MDNKKAYLVLAIIATVAIVMMSTVNVFFTIKDNIDSSSPWDKSVRDLNEYGGTIYYATASSLSVNTIETYTVKADYYSSMYVSDSGTYDYDVSTDGNAIRVTYKFWSTDSEYVSSTLKYRVHTTVTNHIVTIPIDQIRNVTISYSDTVKTS